MSAPAQLGGRRLWCVMALKPHRRPRCVRLRVQGCRCKSVLLHAGDRLLDLPESHGCAFLA